MKTVFYNGQLQMQGAAPKLVHTSNDQQQSSEIDLRRDIFVPLHTHSRTSHTLNNKARNKVSTNKEDPLKLYASMNPSHDNQFSTQKKMEHRNRDNNQLKIDEGQKIKLNNFNPE
jgi:hypothetical protein